MSVNRETLVKDIIKIVNSRHNKKSKFTFLDDCQIDDDDIIYDYWDPNHIYIFHFTVDPYIDKYEIPKYLNPKNEQNQPNIDKTKKFKFFFTGCGKDYLLEGVEIELNTEMNLKQCESHLLNLIEKETGITGKKLNIYLE